MSGRPVPWSSWVEWESLRADLWSDDPRRQQAGLQQVCAWRLRGKLPLGVDATAHLMDAHRADEEWQHAVSWATAFPSDTLERGRDASAVDALLAAGEVPLRLRYSLPLIRLVNGISDSQQRGRVASSVAVLSDAAGLPRALVDVRHEATHNELPSLPLLRAAADSALSWLRENYWDRQRQALAAASARIAALLTCLADSWRAAAAAGLSGGGGAATAVDDDEEEEEQDGEAAASYSGAEGQRVRRQAMSDLRSLLPPAFTHELLTPLLDCAAMRPPEPPALPQEPAQATAQQRQQQQVEELAWKSVMKQLLKWYPRLRLLLLQAALHRLVAAAATPPVCAPSDGALDGGAAGVGSDLHGARTYMCWALRLLPAGAVASAQPTYTPQGAALASPGRRQPQQPRSGKRALPASAAVAAADGRRQQAPDPGTNGSAGSEGGSEPSLDGPLASEQLEALLNIALSGMQTGEADQQGVPSSGTRPSAGVSDSESLRAGVVAQIDAARQDSSSAAAAPSEMAEPGRCLQVVVEVLRRALDTPGVSRGAKRRKLAAEGSKGQADGGGTGGSCGPVPQTDDTAAVPESTGAIDGQDRGPPEGVQLQAQAQDQPGGQAQQQPRRWQRCDDWSRCAIGCLPCPLNPNGRLPQLTGPPPQRACAVPGEELPSVGLTLAAGLGVAPEEGPGAAALAAEMPAAGQVSLHESDIDIPPYESPPRYDGVHGGVDDTEGYGAGQTGQPLGDLPPDEDAEGDSAEAAGGSGLFGTLLRQHTSGGAVGGVGFLL